MVGVSQYCWKKVEKLATPDSQASFLGHPDSGWNTLPGNLCRHRPSPCPAIFGERDLVTRYQALGYFPNENDLVSLPPALLAVQPELLKLVPVVQTSKVSTPHLQNKGFLNILQLVYMSLQARTPKL